LPWLNFIRLAPGQNLNGIWRGKLTQDPGGCYPAYFLELQISAFDHNNISGNSYDFYDKARYVRLDFNGRYNATTKRLVIIESKGPEFPRSPGLRALHQDL
jgi:hypothetical protein